MTCFSFRWRFWSACLTIFSLCSALLISNAELAAQDSTAQQTPTRPIGLKVGRFPVDVRTEYTLADGLPSNDVLTIAVLPPGDVYAGTAKGLAHFDGRRWVAVPALTDAVTLLAPSANGLLAATANKLFRVRDKSVERIAKLPTAARDLVALKVLDGEKILLANRGAISRKSKETFVRDAAFDALVAEGQDIRQVAIAPDGRAAVAATGGLFLLDREGQLSRVNSVDGDRSWLPRNVGGVAFDARGRLWFGSRQGVGVLDGGKWTLYTGEVGLPYNDFTTLAAGPNDTVWFGTTKGNNVRMG